jgi:hypothetical protein
LVVLRNHSAPEVWPGDVGAKRTDTVQDSFGASERPVVHVVFTVNAGPVAEWTLTSVNDHAASPQLLTVTELVVVLPTAWLPNCITSLLLHQRPAA